MLGPTLRCAALRCAALPCAALHLTTLHVTALHCTALHLSVQCTALYCNAVQCDVKCIGAVQCNKGHFRAAFFTWLLLDHFLLSYSGLAILSDAITQTIWKHLTHDIGQLKASDIQGLKSWIWCLIGYIRNKIPSDTWKHLISDFWHSPFDIWYLKSEI